MVRKNSRFQQKAESDSLLVSKKARNAADLKKRLEKYEKLKENSGAAKALAAMGSIGALGKLAFDLESRRLRARRNNMPPNVTGG